MLLDAVSEERVLLVDAASGRTETAGQVRERASGLAWPRQGLAMLLTDGSMEAAVWLLALLKAGQPVALVDAGTPELMLERLLGAYPPDVLLDPSGSHLLRLAHGATLARGQCSDGRVWVADRPGPLPHPDLAVLLTTSGTTGSPKLVRLSRSNVTSNAAQIVASLGLEPDDRGVAALPLHYSFGMSVLTSHASIGSAVVVTGATLLEEAFWDVLREHAVSVLPGVPTTYAMLKRLGFERRELPALRSLIQAGGRLAPELITYFHQLMTARGGQFFVMYGQTEAGPRMSCLPSSRLPEKSGSVGQAVPGGEFEVRSAAGVRLPPGEVGEVHYRGPNVMMGYAETRADLAQPVEDVPVLATGDLGRLDDDGFLFLTGRSKRICKLAGVRVSLDEVEALSAELAPGDHSFAAVDDADGGLVLLVSGLEEVRDLRRALARQLRVPPQLVAVRSCDPIPLLASGKPDYAAVRRLAEDKGPT